MAGFFFVFFFVFNCIYSAWKPLRFWDLHIGYPSLFLENSSEITSTMLGNGLISVLLGCYGRVVGQPTQK